MLQEIQQSHENYYHPHRLHIVDYPMTGARSNFLHLVQEQLRILIYSTTQPAINDSVNVFSLLHGLFQ